MEVCQNTFLGCSPPRKNAFSAPVGARWFMQFFSLCAGAQQDNFTCLFWRKRSNEESEFTKCTHSLAAGACRSVSTSASQHGPDLSRRHQRYGHLGAVLPGAQVTAVETATNISYKAVASTFLS
jgi:hypothetical protein